MDLIITTVNLEITKRKSRCQKIKLGSTNDERYYHHLIKSKIGKTKSLSITTYTVVEL